MSDVQIQLKQAEAGEVYVAPLSQEPPKEQGKYKWNIVPSAYIGFGKGKMDVDWAGKVPDSAPTANKKIKKLDKDGNEIMNDEHDDRLQHTQAQHIQGDIQPATTDGGVGYSTKTTETESMWRRYLCCCFGSRR